MRRWEFMRNHDHRLTALLGIGMSVAFLAGRVAHAANANFQSSMERSFDQSIATLKKTIEKAREGNAEFVEENRKLKDQIKSLQEQLATTPSTVPVDQDSDQRLLSAAAIDEKESRLAQQKINYLRTQITRLEESAAKLQNRINSAGQQEDELRRVVLKLQDEIAALETQKQQFADRLPDLDSVTAQSGGSDLSLAQVQERVEALKKKLREEQSLWDKKSRSASQIQREHDELRQEFAALSEELDSARQQIGLMDREMDAAVSLSDEDGRLSRDIEMLRARAADLQDTVSAMRASLKESKSFEANAARLLSQLEAQKKALRSMLTKSAPSQTRARVTDEDVEQLREQKDMLLLQQGQLKARIAEQKSAGPSPVDDAKPLRSSAGIAADPKLSQELQAIEVRTQVLRNQIQSAQEARDVVDGGRVSAQDRKTVELRNQVRLLESNLERLRSQGQEISRQAPDLSNQDISKLKEDIAQLQSHRAILASSLKSIKNKYALPELTSPQIGTDETQLKEYLETLELENMSLQEKLLTIQMQTDKNAL